MPLDLKKCCVPVTANLMEAMQVIDNSAAGIALVIVDNEKLAGVITDGDIRRALLNGAKLDSKICSYMKKDYLYVSEHEGRAEILDLMQAHLIDQLPIIDKDRKLLGLHLIHNVIGAKPRPNWAVIMAGGKGTRLYPLTKNVPKPMIKVAGRPILERLVLHLISKGIRRIFISVNYLSNLILDHFGNGERFGCTIEYLHEDEPLGTGGSLALLPEKPIDPIIVMNGDLVIDSDLGAMLDFHSKGNFHATVGVKTYTHKVPYGCVIVKDDQVLEMEEKPDLVQQVNAGIYILSPSAVNSIPKTYYPITDFFKSALSKRASIGAFCLEGDWVDVGLPQQLSVAQGNIDSN